MSTDPTVLAAMAGSLLGPYLIIRAWTVFRSLIGV